MRLERTLYLLDVDSLLAVRVLNHRHLSLVTEFLDQLKDVAWSRQKHVLTRKIDCLRAHGGTMLSFLTKSSKRGSSRAKYLWQCRRHRISQSRHFCVRCYRSKLSRQRFSLYVRNTCLECEHKHYCAACKIRPTALNRCLSCVIQGNYFPKGWWLSS